MHLQIRLFKNSFHEALKYSNLHQVLCAADSLSQCQPVQQNKEFPHNVTMSQFHNVKMSNKIKSFQIHSSRLSAHVKLLLQYHLHSGHETAAILNENYFKIVLNLLQLRRLQMPAHRRSNCSSCSTQTHKPEIGV